MNRTVTAPRRRTLVLSVAALVGTAVLAPTLSTAFASDSGTSSRPATAARADDSDGRPVDIDVLAPAGGDNAGIMGAAWFVDLEIDYPATGADGLKASGFTKPQLTGPGVHNNVAPMPGTFSTGKDDRLPGLVVLTSTTTGVPAGTLNPGTNLANLFNLTGVTNRTADETEIWDTWIVGAPIAGKDVDTVLTVAVVDDLDGNGVYDDAPATVTDLNHDGRVDAKDLKALGVASNIETVKFHINGAA